MPRKNKTGIDWSDPEQRKVRMRENARRLKEGKRSHTVMIDGVEYPSQRAAARALGITSQAVWFRVHPEYRREYKRRYQKPRAEAATLRRRWVRVGKESMELAQRMMLHFPDVPSVDKLYEYAMVKLSQHTDD